MPKDIRLFFKKNTDAVKKASKTTAPDSASSAIPSEEKEPPTMKKAKSKPGAKKKASVSKIPPKKGAAVKKKKSKTKTIPKESKRKPKRNYDLSTEDEWREESEEESDNDGIGRKRKGTKNSSKRPIVIDSDDEDGVAPRRRCMTKTIPEIMQSLPKRKTEPKIASPKPEVEFVDPDDFFSQSAPVKKKPVSSSLLIEEVLQRDASLEADKTEPVQERPDQHNKPLVEKEKVETVVIEKSKLDKHQQENVLEEKTLEMKEKLVVSKDQVNILDEGAKAVIKEVETLKDEHKKPVAKEQNNELNETKTKTTTDASLFKRQKTVVPEGVPDCLKNLRFVLTSVLDSLSFDEARDIIIKYGGEVTKSGSISSRTTHVLTGKLSSSSRKLTKARELNVAVIHEDDLFHLIRTRTPPSEAASKKKCVSVPRVLGSGESEMWVDKYRPKTSRDLIGNASAVKQLRDFLKNWPPSSAGKRAALLSGPPGIGKSSAAAIVALECGFEVVEMNASDTRSKKLLANKVERMTASRSIAEFFVVDRKGKRERELLGSKAAMSQSLGKRSVIVMDEVDGMSSGDRGGVQELIKLIKTTKTPVVCICNDRASPKMRSLANYCIDLRFRRPTAQQVMARLGGVARTEGLAVEQPVMAKLSEATRGDIRQMLHTLQLWKASSNSVSFDQATESLSLSAKNFTMNVFDVVPSLFRRLRENEFDWMSTRLDSYFVDPGLVPLMVQGAYLNATPVLSAASCQRLSGAQQELAMLSRYAGASLAISDGDLVDARIRSTMSFALMPTHAVLSSLAPGVILSGDLHARVDFPVWMGKNSTRRKNVRLASELRTHMSRRLTGDTKSMLLDYLPVLRQRLTRPLVMHANDGIEEVVNLMKIYGLSRDDFDAIVELGGAFGAKLSLSAKLKAAFTRHYNSRSGCVPVALGKKKKRKRGEADDKQLVNGDDVAERSDVDQEESADENFDEDNEENDRMIKRKSAPKKKRPLKKKAKVDTAPKRRRSK